jgi:hypothetical protein
MKINFLLSGLGDTALENSVREAVERANYSEQELFDIREPAQYSLFDLISNIDNNRQEFLILQQTASLTSGIVIPGRITNIKTLLKKILARLLKWYIEPMAASQSCFNKAAASLISELLFSVQTQEDTIKRLQKQLIELRKNNV